MGSFNGHFLPGMAYFMLGLWWTFNQLKRYYQSFLRNGPPYKNSASFTYSCPCRRQTTWPVEGLFKIVAAIIGVTGELLMQEHPIYMRNGQHSTMHFFIAMNGVIDLLLHYKVPIPKSLDYITASMAMLVQGFLFVFHLYGRDNVDVVVHTLVAYSSFAPAFTLLLELKLPDSELAGLARSFTFLLMGSWMSQVGWVLYNPFPGAQPWNGDHKQLMLLHMMFAWHMAAIFIIQLCMAGAIACFYHCKTQSQSAKYELLKSHLLPNGINGHIEVSVANDDLELE